MLRGLCFSHRPEPSGARTSGAGPRGSSHVAHAHAAQAHAGARLLAPRASSSRRRRPSRRATPSISLTRKSRNSTDSGDARAGVAARPTDEVDPLGQRRAQRAVDLAAADHRVVPRVVGDHVDVAAGPALALTVDHVHLLEVPDRPRDRGRAHLERLPELSRRHPPVVVGQQAGEHARRRAGAYRRRSRAEPKRSTKPCRTSVRTGWAGA